MLICWHMLTLSESHSSVIRLNNPGTGIRTHDLLCQYRRTLKRDPTHLKTTRNMELLQLISFQRFSLSTTTTTTTSTATATTKHETEVRFGSSDEDGCSNYWQPALNWRVSMSTQTSSLSKLMKTLQHPRVR